MSEEEILLTGGRNTAGVVRFGDTVRRPLRGDHNWAHGLLTHLEEQGFDGSPRFLGIDERDREIMSYLPGDVPSDLGHFAEFQLAAAGALLRRSMTQRRTSRSASTMPK
jgi:hypothetical protein